MTETGEQVREKPRIGEVYDIALSRGISCRGRYIGKMRTTVGTDHHFVTRGEEHDGSLSVICLGTTNTVVDGNKVSQTIGGCPRVLPIPASNPDYEYLLEQLEEAGL